MAHDEALELLHAVREGRVVLCAPRVGRLKGALQRGAVLSGGQSAGVLIALGHGRALKVPKGIEGRVANAVPAETSQPVAYGQVLYELEPIEPGVSSSAAAQAGAAAGENALCVRAPHGGRFWSRPAPDAEAFAKVGTELGAGSAVGLIEVMKTFGPVSYRPGGALPERARVVRVLVSDGAEVDEGTALLEVEPT